MEVVVLKSLLHKNQACIGIYFPKDLVIQNILQKELNARWSRTHQCWYIPLSKNNYQQLANTLKGKAVLKTDALKVYLSENKSHTTQPFIETQNPIAPIPAKHIIAYTTKKSVAISKENEHAFSEYKNRLILKGYSPSTVRTYCNEFQIYLQTIKNNAAKDITPDQLQRYILYCIHDLKLKENTVHSRINALKFYYEQVLNKEKMFFEIPRPKKHLILPKVLGEEELRRLFAAANNLKHKAILFTAYSAGLRVSEVINLRMEDIDRERKQLFVYCSKGKKDRYVALSPLLLDILENYYKSCKPRPVNFLFEGDEPGKPYSIRSAQIIFHNAKIKAGISKTISFHGLRHSFATHMLEKGVDVKFIKEILGHFNIKTTERYLHVSREKLINIESPLDALYRKP
ncbi:MAG: tyrosine-type recombinase/integrase [Chitinophagaceae bacterium]